jgi:hypothetical protein
VILPRGFHPFPSRTRKLSPAGPMVLHAKVCGRVGSCRHKIKAINRNVGSLFLLFARLVTLDTRKLGETPNTIGIAIASEDSNDDRPAYVRFLILLLGEAIAGVFLYALFTFIPMAVQMVIVLAGFVIVQIDIIFYPRKNKSLASLLCGITGILALFCYVAWKITHEDFLTRLGLVGGCLMAALIILDRRADVEI